jgi:hypothetical protein
VVLDRAGLCWPFPRRVRLYPDIRQTAPRAYRAMPPRRRIALVSRAAVQRLSGGSVAPPVYVPPAELSSVKPSPLPVRSAFVVERDETAERIVRRPLATEEALGEAAEVLELQRTALAPAGRGWDQALKDGTDSENDVLGHVFGAARLERLAVPSRLPAAEAIAALHEELLAT